MRHDFNFRIVGNLAQIGGKHAGGQMQVARLFVIADHHRCQHQLPAGVTRGPFAMLDEQSSHAGADGAHSDNADFNLVHGLGARSLRSVQPKRHRKDRICHA